MKEDTQLHTLMAEVAKIIHVDAEAIDPDMPLGQLGIDSFNVVELIMVCQQLFPNMTDFENINFDEHSTLREVHQRLDDGGLHA
jgi:acyl carrier protein